MPFIRSKVTTMISPRQETELKARLGQAISLIPGKSEASLLCGFEGEAHLYLQGRNDRPVAYITVSVFGNEWHEGNDLLFAAITEAFHGVLGIAPDHIYIRYDDLSVWGVCGRVVDRSDFG